MIAQHPFCKEYLEMRLSMYSILLYSVVEYDKVLISLLIILSRYLRSNSFLPLAV